MREVIASGKTVEAATEAACLELGKSRDEVSVEILEMPVKKLFRSIPAKVRVQFIDEKENTQKPEIKTKKIPTEKIEKPAEQIKIPDKEEKVESILEKEAEMEIDIQANNAAKNAVQYLNDVFNAIGANDAKIKVYKQGEATLFRTESAELTSLMEIRGDTIQALSYLVDRSVNRGVDKKDEQYLKIRLDIEGYRDRREQELISLAKRTAEEVQKTKRSRTLAPMNPYERLIIHTTIGDMKDVISESIGNDLDRRVVIRSTDAKAGDRENGRGRRNNRRTKSGGQGGQNKTEKRNFDSPQKAATAPPREYADKNRDAQAEPLVPKRRESIKDGEDLPLYGKIEL